MLVGKVEVLVDRKDYSRAVAAAAMNAAGVDVEGVSDCMRTQSTEMLDDDTIKVTLVHEDLFTHSDMSFAVDDTELHLRAVV